jgi:hypothetical protein
MRQETGSLENKFAQNPGTEAGGLWAHEMRLCKMNYHHVQIDSDHSLKQIGQRTCKSNYAHAPAGW